MIIDSYICGNHFLSWTDKAHEQAYNKILKDLEGDEGPYTRLNVYALTSCETTREHIWDILDFRVPHCVIPGCWNEPWNTSESRLLIALVSLLNEDEFAPYAAAGTLAEPILRAHEWSNELLEAMRPPLDSQEEAAN